MRDETEVGYKCPRCLTQRAEEAHVVVGAGGAGRLLTVQAAQATLGAGVHHLSQVHLLAGAPRLQCQRPCAHAVPEAQPDRRQALVVAITARVVDVEPRRPHRTFALGGHRWEGHRGVSGMGTAWGQFGGGCFGVVLGLIWGQLGGMVWGWFGDGLGTPGVWFGDGLGLVWGQLVYGPAVAMSSSSR